jgi:hypothetical protein
MKSINLEINLRINGNQNQFNSLFPGITFFFQFHKMKLFLLPLLFLSICFVAPVQAQILTSATESEDKIAYLVKLAHIEDRFLSSNELIQNLVRQFTEDEVDRSIVDVISSAFDASQMMAWANESFQMKMNQTHSETLLEYDANSDLSTLMQMLYANNLDFENEEMQQQLERFIIGLERNPEGELRFDEITRIINTTRIIPISVQMLEDVLSTVIFGLNVSLHEDERLPDTEINDLIVTLRLNFRELYNNVIPLTFAFATRNIPLEKLKAHADFLNSPPGQWFIRTGNSATLDSFGNFAQLTSELIAAWALEQSEENQQ